MIPAVPETLDVNADEEGVLVEEKADADDDELDEVDQTAFLLTSCSRCLDLLALVKRLEVQLREARAELALNEGVRNWTISYS